MSAVAIGCTGDRDVIVSGRWDKTVRVWDAATGQPRGGPLTGHTDLVFGVAIGRVGGRDVIVSGSSDNTVRVWDAATGQPRGEPLHNSEMASDGRPMIPDSVAPGLRTRTIARRGSQLLRAG